MSILSMIPAIVSAGSAIYGAIRGNKAAKEQTERQKDLQEHAKALQMDMWKETNYPNQRKQLEKAGLNAGLLYGMGGSGGATTGSVGAGQASQENVYDIGQGVNRALAAAQIEATKAQTEKTKAEAEKIKGVDTQEAESRIGKIIQETTNEKVKNGLLEAETNIKEIQASLDARTFEGRFDMLYWAANKAYEEWQQATIKTYVDKETKQAVIDTIKHNSIGAAIENIAKQTGIEVDKAKINQMAETIAQGWEGLEQGQQKIAVDQFKATTERTYPAMWNSVGRAMEDTFDSIGKLFNEVRPMGRKFK